MLQNLVEFLKWLVFLVNLQSLFVCVGLVDVYHVRFRARPHVEAQRAGLCVLRHLGVPSQELQELRSHPGFDNELNESSVHQTPRPSVFLRRPLPMSMDLTNRVRKERHTSAVLPPRPQPPQERAAPEGPTAARMAA